MKTSSLSCLFLILNCSFAFQTRGDEPGFAKDIQPILAEKCLGCHGPDNSEGGLQLHDSRLAFAETDSGSFALVPGKVEQSTLFDRITSTDESDRMPPEGDRLTKEQIDKIRRWIESGAQFDRHWAYQPVELPSLPVVRNSARVANEIDRFVFSKLEDQKIAPSPRADRATLIKRLYYDLIGLPPTPESVEAFEQETSPEAYEELVDKLLGSEHFGERWGRHWLDKARYADSDGYEKDRPRPNAWRYRDWVIDSINADMPYDQFTVEQLAGDLLPDASPMQRLATAFHRQTLTNTEGGTDREQFRVEATFDRTETVGAIWMGLTLTCARCHTHKYDQITQREYFQLYSFFNDANEGNLKVPTSKQAITKFQADKRKYDRELDRLDKQLQTAIEKLQPEAIAWIKEKKDQVGKQKLPQFHEADLVRTETTSGAKIKQRDNGLLKVEGRVPDKDKYSLYFKVPQLTLSGIRLELPADQDLPNQGPGRAPNGNFVLTQIRVYQSADPEFKKNKKLKPVSAEADFSQQKFSPENALKSDEKSGWAISPQMGKPHSINFFFDQPQELKAGEFLKVVLDQKYGGKHVIGALRVKLISGFDPVRVLPRELVDVIKVDQPTEKQIQRVGRFLAGNRKETRSLVKKYEDLKAKPPAKPEMQVRVMVPANRTTQVLHRGDFLQPGEQVAPDVIQVVRDAHALKIPKPKSPPNRLDLARWLVDPRHPLTARVTVNHVWGHLFGRGIVASENDFGVRGDLPSHPELLDWLAWNFSRSMKWSRKSLIKKIVMSETYRQSSVVRADLATLDPANQLLARQNRIRVPAEIVRDLYLSASGLMSPKIGGPSVFPPLPAGVANLSYANNFKWKTSTGADRYRRGMYTFFKRTSPHPNLVSFDCPDSNTSKIRREISNTPIQALVTLNNEVYLEAAQALARRVIDARKGRTERVRYALRLCVSRNPSDTEVEHFVSLLKSCQDYYAENEVQAKQLTNRHQVDGISVSLNAAWVATARMIMNLDEFIVRE